MWRIVTVVITFCIKEKCKDRPFEPGNYTFDNTIHVSEQFCGGGTDFESLLTEAIFLMKNGDKNADIAIITDDECWISDKFTEKFTSAATEPSDPAKQRINTIGGKNWKTAGQWIVWQVRAEKDGLYRVSFRAKQNIVNGAYSSRILTVNGDIPCKEATQIRFDYDWNWQMYTAKAGDEDMLVYLNEGLNEIGLEVTLGDVSDLIQQVSSIIQDLNGIYQDIYMITGHTPDVYNDYQFHIKIPDSIKQMETIAKQLSGIFERYKKVTGQDGNSAQPILTMQMTLEELYHDPDKISYTVSRLKNNISALGTWVLNAAEQPLEIDYIILSDTQKELPSANGTILNQFLFGIKTFIASFIEDYSMVSGSDDAQNAESNVKIWIGNSITGGRDQAQILKQIVDDDFTPKKGISAEIQLVAMNSLLTATLAGKGPDIAISLAGAEPMNYAMRNAVIDLTQFKDFDAISKRFKPSALTPLTFDDSVYGLPETQTFFMLFYRKDVLQKLGLSVPQTWDDVITMLPILQKKQLNFGFPQLYGDYIGMGFYTYAMFLFQNGGTFYEKDGIVSALNSKEAIDSFVQLSKYYTDYLVPTQYDFVNRFRSGEVPIGIADYTAYNQLSVFAPEISGLWDFAEVPGILKEDGIIDRSVAGNITACSILSDSKNQKGAWEFLKWWTDAEIQSRYGLELESTLGSAARYSPANVEAMKMIPWSTQQLVKIFSQWEHVKGVEEVPGGYFTPREVDIAYRAVIFDDEDPGEALEDAALAINFEIDSKRNEFGLPVYQKGGK